MNDDHPPPMTKECFVALLEDILKEKKEKNNFKYRKPYDVVYDKCLLGYEMSHAKKQYEEDIPFKTIKGEKEEIQAQNHLKYVLESLIEAYGIAAVINTLKDI